MTEPLSGFQDPTTAHYQKEEQGGVDTPQPRPAPLCAVEGRPRCRAKVNLPIDSGEVGMRDEAARLSLPGRTCLQTRVSAVVPRR
jgi:hypothetical protein